MSIHVAIQQQQYSSSMLPAAKPLQCFARSLCCISRLTCRQCCNSSLQQTIHMCSETKGGKPPLQHDAPKAQTCCSQVHGTHPCSGQLLADNGFADCSRKPDRLIAICNLHWASRPGNHIPFTQSRSAASAGHVIQQWFGHMQFAQ